MRSVYLGDRGLQITLDAENFTQITARLSDDEAVLDRTQDSITVSMPILFASRGSRTLVLPASSRPSQPDSVLIGALRKAHSMLRTKRGMPLIDAAPRSPYERSILRLAFLAPDIQQAILEGRQPHNLNLETFKKIAIPLSWETQRQVLGFGQR